MKWHIGCSGFYYKHWKEIFYPIKVPQRLWFEYYCKYFDTVELNVTFYRFPQVSMLKGWYNRSPDDFSFSVKAPKGITHYKKLNNCEGMLADFYGTVEEGLREKAGCLLFQFPPSFVYTKIHLDLIIASLNLSFPNVVEFRHKSWWNEDVYKSLAEANITFSGMSHPYLPDKIIINNTLFYYRMHGVPQLYQSPYSLESLLNLIKVIKDENNRRIENAYIYFNNDMGGAAIENAKEMIEIIK